MSKNIVHIESSNKDNKSFGTGFVIESNQEGTYILTCQHVLGTVQDATIEAQPVEIVVQNSFLDMAIIFLPSVEHKKMTLQLAPCHDLNITTIAFSNFKKDLVQKSTIHATLFKDFIELHSTEDDTFYLIKKIKADEDYKFSRGNSGAPIICNKTANVIAMLSNKEGTNLAYAIGISCIKKLLEQLNNDEDLMQKHEEFYLKFSTFKKEVSSSVQTRRNPKNRAIFHINELKKENSDLLTSLRKKLFKLKYFFLGVLSVFALYGVYSFVSTEKTKKVNTAPYYQVTNLPSHETLNVRKGAGQGYKVIDELLPSANHIRLIKCKHNDEGIKWCQINYRETTGWVHSRYIVKAPRH
ncbi:MAG: Serine/threonine kinase [uncultured Sulfurovum sp.]|uniref:Serine/threonine kinase n=1 Tax=uncultured Sulfurovum sp. TaxID=269237 RepID=A0A6S6S2H8_9BACT|nr:MAG: Serine/threonine kinase [uncultured Sulfurovum sp.]